MRGVAAARVSGVACVTVGVAEKVTVGLSDSVCDRFIEGSIVGATSRRDDGAVGAAEILVPTPRSDGIAVGVVAADIDGASGALGAATVDGLSVGVMDANFEGAIETATVDGLGMRAMGPDAEGESGAA